MVAMWPQIVRLVNSFDEKVMHHAQDNTPRDKNEKIDVVTLKPFIPYISHIFYDKIQHYLLILVLNKS